MMNNLIERLKIDVDTHPVLENSWLKQREENLSLPDLKNWLSQEYFVSQDFVTWFLKAASQTTDLDIRILLVENVWEELGEGSKEESHLEILRSFLLHIGFDFANHPKFSGTEKYLEKMREIIDTDIYYALGALGPANEYLLKKEYGKMYRSYLKLKENENLPEGAFFEINLHADEGHSKKLFHLISTVCNTEERIKAVIAGNLAALDARVLFYESLP